MAALGLCYFEGAFSGFSKWGLLFVGTHGLLIVVASLAASAALGTPASAVAAQSSVAVACRLWTVGS